MASRRIAGRRRQSPAAGGNRAGDRRRPRGRARGIRRDRRFSSPNRRRRMSALWNNDGNGWRLLAPAGFPDEAALHSLVEEAPHVLPLSGSPTLVVVGREVQLETGKIDLLAIEPTGRLALIEVKL